LQRLFGLRDFKLKVGVPGWERALATTHHVLRGALDAGKATLRVDANGGWTLAQALEAAPLLERHGVTALEQPLAKAADEDLLKLSQSTTCAIVPDESLLTIEDAERLIGLGAGVLNIRIAKNGGLMPALRIAQAALAAGREVQLGCLVGETSVLTAAGVCFLRATPRVRFVEGAFGRWLLRADVARPSLRFGYGGRPPRIGPHGLGVDVAVHRVESYTSHSLRSIYI
jgi:muconate cycloisomerase